MLSQTFEPSYLALHRSGELQDRAASLEAGLKSCDLCARECRVDRTAGQTGFCRSGVTALVASYCEHHGEEPALSGMRGSGTIFFAHCTMRCVFCQNHQISQAAAGTSFPALDAPELARCMLYLQDVKHCHNINLVSPTQFLPQIVRSLDIAVRGGLRIPLVYNTNGYDSLHALQALDGVVDIYLPDLKYASNEHARRFSQAPGYVEHARRAIKEMHRQVGLLAAGGDGIAVSGLIVRHLVLPNGIAGSAESLDWLAREVSPRVTVSLMAQYMPVFRASRVPLLARRISGVEYAQAIAAMEALGMENGWLQGMDSPQEYTPDFSSDGHPFHRHR